MRKFLIIGLFMLIFNAVPVSAANGGISGNIYSTDIKACINGVWVDSYNIGGKTVVILEDITDNCHYNDSYRMLVCNGLSPDGLNEGKDLTSKTPGKVIGNIYETDIKTYIYGKEIPSYSLNGKMAVAIEDLGGDGEFSEILGRFLWDSDERTITLELAYDNWPSDLLNEKHLDMNINYDTLTIDFTSEPILYGMTTTSGWQELPDIENRADFTYKDEIVLRTLKYDKFVFYDNNGVYTLEKNPDTLYYYDINKLTELLSDVEPKQPTYKDWLDFFENNTLSTTKDSLETDDYIFLYMYFSNSHGGSDGLVKLNKTDGTRIDYDDSFKSVSYSGNKDFENVRIDRENEKVYLHYDVDYVINLKTDVIEPVEAKEDLLLIEDFLTD